MKKITNLTNSPFDLQGVDGLVRLPAFDSVKGEFSGEYLDLLEASMAVSVEDTDAEPEGQAAEQGVSEPKAKRAKKAA
ncbi:hypothetical protein Daci_4094 [Delftia acidovorans SPH-1]|uniref:Uncharacterized protein n=1 Tax=Delftia acidovorans (strain DSM 14801 / SPH-1) TaxID=398578 RepID=A9C0F9_DELAS|nr:hypothetical protein [Delftia acidovorans]ABX36725.1 hypothetical protein Daci_4094 [Delftia acidovorans SPH-1]QPS74024.1 hypothetical protein I6G48_25840 [Delftia acidovorans]